MTAVCTTLRALLVASLLAVLATPSAAFVLRTVSGVVTWQGTNLPAAGVLVKVWDNDNIGKELMGQVTTNAAGWYSIGYNGDRNWDSCCFSATNPDPLIEVCVDGVLYMSTGELASNVDTNRVFNLVLPTRSISGYVFWSASGERVAGATVKAWDSDTIGREAMGQSLTSSTGNYLITYNPNRRWDDCCGSSTLPDPELEVWWNGQLWLTTNEYSNVNGNLVVNIGLTRILVSGNAYWQETCGPAPGVTVQVKDDDTVGSEFMGRGTTTGNGSYTVSVPYKINGESNWDTCCGSDTSPDVFSEFSYGNAVKGRTGSSNNFAVSPGYSRSLNQGSSWLWRGDSTYAAKATEQARKPDLQDWIVVEEFNGCKPRVMKVTIYVNFQMSGKMTSAQWEKLKALFKQGIAENWSRYGAQAVRLPTSSSSDTWDVYTTVVEDPNGKNAELEWVTDKDFERSNNVGAIAFLDFDPIIYYNKGFYCSNYANGCDDMADTNFIDTAGHEFGHSFLRNAPPPTFPAYFPWTRGQSYSWTHKGTSSVLQNVNDDAPMYSNAGEQDLMFYYRGTKPWGWEARSIAAEYDVQGLVAQAKRKYSRQASCGCPPSPSSSKPASGK